MPDPSLAIGLDLGTSGCRAVAIDPAGRLIASSHTTLEPPARPAPAHSEQDPRQWREAAWHCLRDLAAQISPAAVSALAIDGTSASLFACNEQGEPLGPALLYNDSRAQQQAQRLASLPELPEVVQNANSSLAKALWLQQHYPTAAHLLHPSDWLSGLLCGRLDISDENNALKMGYDVDRRGWPETLNTLLRTPLPQVSVPGTSLGPITPVMAQFLGLPENVLIKAGTTDSTAALIATGACRPGDAVTSLGSTLVIKVISELPVCSAADGIYSHRLGNHWLAGGASNSGGAVLRQYFSDATMQRLSALLNPAKPTGLDYYPLPAPGERFPIVDAHLAPRLTPRPDDEAIFFQAMLEGIAAIEQRGYQRLQELGAPWPRRIYTSGGGAGNVAWREIRENLLGVPVVTALHSDAAYGAARLAQGWEL